MLVRAADRSMAGFTSFVAHLLAEPLAIAGRHVIPMRKTQIECRELAQSSGQLCDDASCKMMTVRIHVTFWGVLHVTVTLSQRSTNQLSESWPARGQVQSFRSYVVGACKEDLICFFSGGPGVVQHDLFLPPKVAAVLSRP